MVIGSQQKLRSIDSEINIRVNENGITRVESVKSLGVYIDKHLTWHDHIDKLCKKVASAIGALKRVRSLLYNYRRIHTNIPSAHSASFRLLLHGMGWLHGI